MFRGEGRYFYNDGYQSHKHNFDDQAMPQGQYKPDYFPKRSESPHYYYPRPQNPERRFMRYNTEVYHANWNEMRPSSRPSNFQDFSRQPLQRQHRCEKRTDLEIATNIINQQREMRTLIEQLEPMKMYVENTWD